MSGPSHGAPPAAAALLDAVSAIAEHQLPTGEILACAPGADGRLVYRRSLRSSIAIHDALACLDPRSAGEETRSVRAFLAPAATSRLCLGAARIRRHIRAFLAWHELPRHLWRDDGRHGELSADPALSAAAAAELMDDPARAADRWPLYTEAVARALAAISTAPTAPDLAAAATVAGFLALAGEEAQEPIDRVEREIERIVAGGGAPLPLEPACTVARWWARAHLPGRARMAAALAPGLLARLHGAGGDAIGTAEDDPGTADAARTLLALLDLGSAAPEISLAARRLLAALPHTAGWTGGRSAAGAPRCPALTRALVMAAAVRSHALAEEVAPCTAMAS